MSHKNNLTPLVSVILPVYNGGPFLHEAIQSILSQTFTDFEFIIINDGSTDNSEAVIGSFSDPRIRYHKQPNSGLGATLNLGIELSRGKYIARQDQDDISLPERFEKQVQFMEVNPSVVLLGTRAKIFSEGTREISYHMHATRPCDLKFDLLFNNPFVHSSVIFRSSTIHLVGKYNPDRNLYEDYDLWSRLSVHGDVANLAEVLLEYRHHEAGLSKNFTNFREMALYNQGMKNIVALLGKRTDAMSDLVALYHWKDEILKGAGTGELDSALNEIAAAITKIYPHEERAIQKRKKQYQKIIRYRINILKCKKNPEKKWKLALLLLERKLCRLQAFVINE